MVFCKTFGVVCFATLTAIISAQGEDSRRISQKKCEEYSNWPTKERTAKRCGAHSNSGEIVNVPAEPMEFPHMARLGYFNNATGKVDWVCGGNLISERFVVSAAHCARKSDGSQASHVRLGVGDAKMDVKLEEVIVHPNSKKSSRYDDIALYKMEKDVDFTNYLRPACLEDDSNLTFEKFVTSGWRWRGEFGAGVSDELIKTVVPVESAAACNESFAPHMKALPKGIDDATMICAGKSVKSEICQGNSGSPIQVLMSSPDCMYKIVGLASFGTRCGTGHTSDVYVRVSAYLPWIEPIVWPTFITLPKSHD